MIPERWESSGCGGRVATASCLERFQAKLQGPQVEPGVLPELRRHSRESGETKGAGGARQRSGEADLDRRTPENCRGSQLSIQPVPLSTDI